MKLEVEIESSRKSWASQHGGHAEQHSSRNKRPYTNCDKQYPACEKLFLTSTHAHAHTHTHTLYFKNKTKFIPKSIVINNKTYEVETQKEGEEPNITAKENTYLTIIDGLKETGNQTITIEKIILDNSKEIEVNQTIQVKVTKNVPVVVSWRTNKEIQPDIDINKNKKKIIVCDEAWLFLKFHESAEFLVNVARRRKKI